MSAKTQALQACAAHMLVALLFFSPEACTHAALTLAAKGRSPFQIVVASNAIPSERYAAEELQRYVETITGAKLATVTDSEPARSAEILLGDNAHLKRLGLKVEFNELGPEGFVLRTDHNKVIIAGGQPRGTLYGVYTFLEERLGVRWFTPEV